MKYIKKINSPSELKKLSTLEVNYYIKEIREFLIEKVTSNGGHLGPNLGVVELTIAIHRVFDSPKDPIIFDTGHQSYVHKIITGRSKYFKNLRMKNGLSGYQDRSESKHDFVESSHASSSLSTAFGIAKGFEIDKNTKNKVVAVIGDGALTGGMAWEAINNISSTLLPIVIIVNDNGRSYAPTVGGVANYLNNLRMASSYEKAVNSTKSLIKKVPKVGDSLFKLLRGMKTGIREAVYSETFFSNLGLKYIGPVDGHNEEAVENALKLAKEFKGPVIVHVITKKGFGYEIAEKNKSDLMHSTDAINPVTGIPKKNKLTDWTSVFSDILVKEGTKNSKIVAITAAMSKPTGISNFGDKFPERIIDVGIAEQHAITTASGLALQGKIPIFVVYSTFFNRAFDQFLFDVALLKLPIIIVLDRAGITGNDGPSHNGVWDISLLNIVPGVKLGAPRDKKSLENIFKDAIANLKYPSVIRYPKGEIPKEIKSLDKTDFDADIIFKTNTDVKKQEKILIISIGSFANRSIEFAEKLAKNDFYIEVIDPNWVFPLTEKLIKYVLNFNYVITLEDGLVENGFGSLLLSKLNATQKKFKLISFGTPKEFLYQASRAELLEDFNLTPEKLLNETVKWIENFKQE